MYCARQKPLRMRTIFYTPLCNRSMKNSSLYFMCEYSIENQRSISNCVITTFPRPISKYARRNSYLSIVRNNIFNRLKIKKKRRNNR